MKCTLCKKRKANVKNTHYLTDGIIKKCLNYQGVNEREKGFYIESSNQSSFIEFNFQRISEDNLKKKIGRTATEVELKNARQIPYTVDDYFCRKCESLFADFEDRFIKEVLPKLRNEDLSKKNYLLLNNSSLIRMFFYIQIWRSAICEKIFALDPVTQEKIRKIILNKEFDSLKNFPITITYLETLGGNKSYTENCICFADDKNPYIIFMNDFVIQFYDSENQIDFTEFYGLNKRASFKDYINIEEDNFKIHIIHNLARKELQETIFLEGNKRKTYCLIDNFKKEWQLKFGKRPDKNILKKYIDLIFGKEPTMLSFSEKRIKEITKQFISNSL